MILKHFDNFRKYRFLLFDLIGRDLKVKYRRSVLGLFWSILNPLLMMLVITAVFSQIFKFNIEFFPIYYLTGATLYNFVVESTSNAMVSIIHAAPLIKKVYIPKYIFPVEKILFAFVNLLFSLIAVVIVVLILGMSLPWPFQLGSV
jgi:ABC-2 type transport system permease protein